MVIDSPAIRKPGPRYPTPTLRIVQPGNASGQTNSEHFQHELKDDPESEQRKRKIEAAALSARLSVPHPTFANQHRPKVLTEEEFKQLLKRQRQIVT